MRKFKITILALVMAMAMSTELNAEGYYSNMETRCGGYIQSLNGTACCTAQAALFKTNGGGSGYIMSFNWEANVFAFQCSNAELKGSGRITSTPEPIGNDGWKVLSTLYNVSTFYEYTMTFVVETPGGPTSKSTWSNTRNIRWSWV